MNGGAEAGDKEESDAESYDDVDVLIYRGRGGYGILHTLPQRE